MMGTNDNKTTLTGQLQFAQETSMCSEMNKEGDVVSLGVCF